MKIPLKRIFFLSVLCLQLSAQDTGSYARSAQELLLLRKNLQSEIDSNMVKYLRAAQKFIRQSDTCLEEIFTYRYTSKTYKPAKGCQCELNAVKMSPTEWEIAKKELLGEDVARAVKLDIPMADEFKIYLRYYFQNLARALLMDMNNVQPYLKTELLSYMRKHRVLLEFYHHFDEFMEDSDFRNVLNVIKKENKKLLMERLNEVEEGKFIGYQSDGLPKRKIKEFSFAHHNDILSFTGHNQDRELTGAAEFRAGTDYFNMKGLDPVYLLSWLVRRFGWRWDYTPYLQYQAISVGNYAYTPYIRYRNNFEMADSLYKFDRPFSNYTYVERAAHRIWPSGWFRYTSHFQIGFVGTELGRNVQARLHKDAAVKSQKVYGWDRQIAYGGRLVLQLEYRPEMLLISTSNEYGGLLNRKLNPMRDNDFGFNMSLSPFVTIGGYLSGAGARLGFSSLDFTRESGLNSIRPNNESRGDNDLKRWGLAVEAGISYRYVIHNTALEGFGYFNTVRNDDYDDEEESSYTLNMDYYREWERDNANSERATYPRPPAAIDQVNRDIFSIDWGLRLRYRKTTFYWKVIYQTKEFDIKKDKNYYDYVYLADPEDTFFVRDKVVKELRDFDSWKFYPYGTLGIVWVFD